MADIVRRLREPPFGTETSERNLMNQAADEITRLRAEVEDAHRREACAADLAREWESHCKTAEAEITRLTAENAAHNHAAVKYLVEILELRAEVERLKEQLDELEVENAKLRAVLQRVRRWGSPMVRGYIDGALGGSNRILGVMHDDKGGEVAAQEKEK